MNRYKKKELRRSKSESDLSSIIPGFAENPASQTPLDSKSSIKSQTPPDSKSSIKSQTPPDSKSSIKSQTPPDTKTSIKGQTPTSFSLYNSSFIPLLTLDDSINSKLPLQNREILVNKLAAKLADDKLMASLNDSDRTSYAMLTVQHILRDAAYVLSWFCEKSDPKDKKDEFTSTVIFYNNTLNLSMLYSAQHVEKFNFFPDSAMHARLKPEKSSHKQGLKITKSSIKSRFSIKPLSEEYTKKLSRTKDKDLKFFLANLSNSESSSSPHSPSSTSSDEGLATVKVSPTVSLKNNMIHVVKPSSAILPICYGSGWELTGDFLREVIEEFKKINITDISVFLGKYDEFNCDEDTMTKKGELAAKKWETDNEQILRTFNIKKIYHPQIIKNSSYRLANDALTSLLSDEVFCNAVISDSLVYLQRKLRNKNSVPSNVIVHNRSVIEEAKTVYDVVLSDQLQESRRLMPVQTAGGDCKQSLGIFNSQVKQQVRVPGLSFIHLLIIDDVKKALESTERKAIDEAILEIANAVAISREISPAKEIIVAIQDYIREEKNKHISFIDSNLSKGQIDETSAIQSKQRIQSNHNILLLGLGRHPVVDTEATQILSGSSYAFFSNRASTNSRSLSSPVNLNVGPPAKK